MQTASQQPDMEPIFEDMGYDVPFTTFTWEHWQQLQARTLFCFARFQRAIEHRQLRLAIAILTEMQETVVEMQKEVYEWMGVMCS